MNIVITGSTKGIGYGLAKEFLKKGHNVLINGRNRMLCEKVYRELHAEFPENHIHIYACDITNYNSIQRMFWEAERFYGKVDVWINNAGMNQTQLKITEHNKEDISNVIDLNLKAAIYGTKVAAEGLLENGGFIYNMEGFGSDGRKAAKMSVYGASKIGISYFTKSIAKELKDTKVKIGTLSPGMVITDLLLDSLPENPKEKARAVKIYNILADKVETVTPFLVNKIIKNRKNNSNIKWLTNRKAFFRFIFKSFRKDIIKL